MGKRRLRHIFSDFEGLRLPKDGNLYVLGLLILFLPWALAATPASTLPAKTLEPPAALMTSGPDHRDAEIDALAKFWWSGRLFGPGPLSISIDRQEQTATIRRGGQIVGQSIVSTGRPGKATPHGRYTILEKSRRYYSKKYGNAPMPFMQRITEDGIALHGGPVPGFPVSRGCIRFPVAFARLLFSATDEATEVTIY